MGNVHVEATDSQPQPSIAVSQASMPDKPAYLGKMKSDNAALGKGVVISIFLLVILLVFWFVQLRKKGGFGSVVKEIQAKQKGSVRIKQKLALSRTLNSYVLDVDGESFLVLEKTSAVTVVPLDKQHIQEEALEENV